MMSNTRRAITMGFTLAAMVLAACGGGEEPGEAESQADSLSRRVVQLHVTSEDGQETDILLPEGGSIKVSNAQLGVSYRLTGQIFSDDRATILVEQYSDVDLKVLNATDVLDLHKGSESLMQSTITPFSLRMTGLTVEKAQTGTRQEQLTNTCCAYCGGWYFCCTPAPGYCCRVNTSCGTSCTTCN